MSLVAASPGAMEPVAPAEGRTAELQDADGAGVLGDGADACQGAWPEDPMELGTFAEWVATMVAERGYCFVQMDDSSQHRDGAVSAIRDHGEWVLPKKECEEAFLGQVPAKMAWISFEPEFEPLVYYCDRISDLGGLLEPLAEDLLGFRADGMTNMFARAAFSTPAEVEELQTGSLDREDVEAGVVEEHLDFVRRRRLCLMHVVAGEGGAVSLRPRGGSDVEAVTLPMAKDRLLVFRHDVMNYAYTPKDSSDLALMSWLLEEPARLRLDRVEGDQLRMEAVLGGGPSVPPSLQVHVMSAFTNFPGKGKGCGGYWTAQVANCDGFTEIPLFRWDHSEYYDPTGEHPTKAKCRHASLLQAEDLMFFDNAFFGIQPAVAANIAPGTRVALEGGFEALHTLGYTRKTLRGQNMGITLAAQSGIEWDFFKGYEEDASMWARSSAVFNRVDSVALMAHTYGTRGPTLQVDTACSSGLVATNTVFAMLKQNKRDDHKFDDVKMGMAAGCQNCLQPTPFVGLSKAGMLGVTGRVKFADNSADGFARGEAIGGTVLEVADHPHATKNRLAVQTGGYINQDGRSASLTAPNGPSQQACIRGSLRDANQAPEETQCNENHGTGTAIGDPIETGSIRACFRNTASLPVSSGKSHNGHAEMCAGVASFIKSILQTVSGAVPANCHLLKLNHHIDLEGWPGLFATELTDLGTLSVNAGLCSFGFGGTNARADVWGMRLPGRGSNSTGFRQLQVQDIGPQLDAVLTSCAQCGSNMCWRCGEVPTTRAGERHYCAAIREELASYDICGECYSGGYKHSAPTP